MKLKHYLATGLLMTAVATHAQSKKSATVDVKTSTVCGMCEQTIETELIYEKGVKAVDVDLQASLVHVDYDPRKTGPDRIREAISALGYNADDVPGDPEAFKKLPTCCQKEGCGTGRPVE